MADGGTTWDATLIAAMVGRPVRAVSLATGTAWTGTLVSYGEEPSVVVRTPRGDVTLAAGAMAITELDAVLPENWPTMPSAAAAAS